MVRFRSLTAGLAVVGLLATGVAFAQGQDGGRRGRGGPFGRGGGVGLPLAQLNLTEAQQTQLQTIREQHRDAAAEAIGKLETARRAQQAAIEKVPADEAQITSLTQDLTQAEVDVAIQRSRLNTAVWSVLTPAQQAQATKMKAERQARMQERRQRSNSPGRR
jgi:periplasmic protein CpxP/Spy